MTRTSPTSTIVRASRLLRFILHVMRGVATIGLVFPFISRARQVELTRHWAAGILDIFGVEVSIRGAAPTLDASKAVFVSNHVSWLDPALIIARRPAHFVAKSEIRDWPVLGWLAEKAGTLFIERGRRHDTGRISRSLVESLNAGECIGLFPEGTTTDGTMLKPFHASLLQAAVTAEAPLYPVAIRYLDAGGGIDTAPAYTGNLSFGESLKRILTRRVIRAELTFAAPIPAAGKTRRELALLAEQAIANALRLASPRSGTETPGDPPAAGR